MVDAPVVLDDFGLELLPVLGEVGGLLWRNLLAPGLVDRGVGSRGDRAVGRGCSRATRGVEGGIGGVHLVVVVLDRGPQLAGVGLGLGGFGHAGDDGVVARGLK